MKKYIISQTIGIIAFIISLVAYHRNKKEKILGNMILSNILNLVHYILLGAYTGCITKGLAIFRDGFIILKENNEKYNKKFFLYIFVIIYVISSVVSYKNIWSLFPLIAAVIYLIPIWGGNKKIVKQTALFFYFLWLIYNIFIFSIAGIISNIISIISTAIAVFNENKKFILKKKSYTDNYQHY